MKLNFWLILVIVVSFISLSLYLGYRSLVVTPSINLADGLDPEEAAFLQKSISKDQKTKTGVAPAPVVKVTVKDKDTGEEYTSKVLLKNIDKPDNVSVENLTAAITKTVVENNTPVKPSPVADPASLPPLPPTSQSCSTVATGQWAQTGTQYQIDGKTACSAGEACAGLRECAQCVDGKYDLTNKQVCGQGQAVLYLTRPEEGKNAPCWEGGVQYADNSSFAGKGKCSNGKWVEIVAPTATPISDDLEQVELDYLAEVKRKDDLHLTPSIAPSSNQSPITPPNTQTPNIPDPPSIDDRTPSSDTQYFSTKSACESSIDKTKEQCNILPGGGYGSVPLVVSQEPAFNPFNFGSANSGGSPTTLSVGDSCSRGIIFGWGDTCSQCPNGDSYVSSTANFQARRVCGEEQSPTTPQVASNNDATDESTPSCGLFDRNSCGEGGTCEFNWQGFNSKWECVGDSNDLAFSVTDFSNTTNSPLSSPNPVNQSSNNVYMEYAEEPELVQSSEDFVYYGQRDEQWEDTFFTCADGDKVPFKQVGCGQTALAMVMATYSDSSITPEIVKEKYFTDPGYCGGSGASPSLDILEDNGYTLTRNPKPDDIAELLSQGQIFWAGVAFNVNGKRVTHHTLITGITQDGKYIYQDPWYGPDTILSDLYNIEVLGYTAIQPPDEKVDKMGAEGVINEGI